jgi:hypothetical protein
MGRLALAAAGIGLIVAGSRLLQRKRADLQGQVVLITGSSRGLGLALAEEFATADILGVTDRLLPSSQEQGTDRYSGKESETAVTRSFLTALGQKAVKTYNQTTV